MCETANGYCTSIHRAESLTFSLWRITGAVNGWPVEHATRPHRSGGTWSGTVAVTPRSGRLRADAFRLVTGLMSLVPVRVRLRACERGSHALPQSVEWR